MTRALVDEAQAVGTELLGRIRAPGAKRPPGSLAEKTVARDRLWSLLVQRHDLLWRVGAYLLGRDVDRFVPGLQAQPAKKKA